MNDEEYLVEEYIQTGNINALKELLDLKPALANGKTSLNVSPLLLSCYYKKPEISDIILKFIKDLNIHESAAVGKFDSLASNIYKNPELINSFSDDGFTPLGLACYFGHEDSARYLLLKGAEVNACSKNGFNVYPIQSAVAANNIEIAKILLEAGADVNVRQISGVTPLHSAAQHGNIDLIILLLEAGANVNAVTEDGKTAADLASLAGFNDLAKILA
ncbi:ankyrin repeat domain-containing protein [Pedobacter sp. P351]|uniref:ankyrin repeat domain-containing protein n=1 Tax=Pedobacter superstes TaxID=3133441 RepID=UPI0030B340FE